MSEIRVTSVVGESGGDRVGLTTGLTVGPLTGTTGIGATITHQGHAQFAGVCTATSFVGNGAGLTNVGNPNAMQVLEEFFVPCNGTAVTMAQGSVAIQNVTSAQTSTGSLVDCDGSTISYQPPANTKLVIYTYCFQYSYGNNSTILGFQPFLDGVSVNSMPFSIRTQNYGMQLVQFQHGFRIESSADASIGQVTSWNSAKTIKLQFRHWSNSYSGKIHNMGEGFRASDGSFENNQFRKPSVGIKAIGSL